MHFKHIVRASTEQHAQEKVVRLGQQYDASCVGFQQVPETLGEWEAFFALHGSEAALAQLKTTENHLVLKQLTR